MLWPRGDARDSRYFTTSVLSARPPELPFRLRPQIHAGSAAGPPSAPVSRRQFQREAQILRHQPEREAGVECARQHELRILVSVPVLRPVEALKISDHLRRDRGRSARRRAPPRPPPPDWRPTGSCSAPSWHGPSPDAPVRNTCPIGSRSGRQRATTAGSPPAMMDSLPSTARLTPPETGASSSGFPSRQLAAQLARAHGRGRGHVDDDRPGTSRSCQSRCHARLTHQHVANDLAVGKHRDDDAARRARSPSALPVASQATCGAANARRRRAPRRRQPGGSRLRPDGAPSAHPCCRAR